jgi:hypothetical protein
LWFYDNHEKAVYVPAGKAKVEPLEWKALEQTLTPATFYLSNLTLDALHERVVDHPDAANRVLHDKGLIVSAKTIADELGLGALDDAPSDEQNAILISIRDAFQAACFRLGLNLAKTGIQQRHIRKEIFARTASEAMQATSIEDANLSLSPAPHRWVSVPLEWVENTHFRRITLQRQTLYPSLLRKPVPIGQWKLGSDHATPDMILNAVSDHHDILLEAQIKVEEGALATNGFLSVIATQTLRTLYTGQEVRKMVDEGISFSITRWWHGPTAPAPALPEIHPLSLADGLMLEMIHRSWRENPEIGFWISIAERMTLHHLAGLFFKQGVEVSGYGSGKLTVRAPNDPAASQNLDKRLLRDHHAFGIQLPLDALRSHPDLPELVELLTDQQAIALAAPGLLGPIDQSINEGDQSALESYLEKADDALQAMLTTSNGNDTATATSQLES